MDFPDLPSFYEDPMFQIGQKDLYGFGTDFMAGRIPEYYRSIGEAGGPEFNEMLRLNTEDITRAGYESAARMGTKGGATQSNILKSIRSMAVPLRWADFTRSLQGRQGFLDTGVNAITGVRNAGLQFGGQKNQFNLNEYGLKMDQMKMIEAEKARKDAMWSEIISGALGAAGTIGGVMLAGPAGASVGSQIGSASGKSIVGGSPAGFDPLDFYSGRFGNMGFSGGGY